MAEEVPSSSSTSTAASGKMTVMVGVDDSEPSWYALQWTLQHFFPPAGLPPPSPYRLVVVTAKPAAPCNVGLAGPGAADVVSFVENDLKRSSKRVIQKAKDLCAQVNQLQVGDAVFEVVEGDARNVLCEAVERHHAELLVVGSHGYGVIKRAVLGSVSDYCIHHAQCTVMIAKKPKYNH